MEKQIKKRKTWFKKEMEYLDIINKKLDKLKKEIKELIATQWLKS